MMENFKEEIKTPLKKWRIKQTKNWKKLIYPSQKHKNIKKKTNKQVANSSRLEG